MSDLRSFTKEFMIEFIELYKSYPCLWKTKCKDYMNRSKKDAAYETLLKKLQEIEPSATKKTVKAKINSIRGSFRREMKKMDESKRSGAGTDEIYVTHLWYYDLLLFCKDQEIPRTSVSNIEDQESQEKSEQENNDEGEENGDVGDDIEIPTPSATPTSGPAATTYHTTTEMSYTPTSTASQGSSKKRKGKVDQQADDILIMVGDRLRASATNNDDPYNIFGKNVSAKLKTLSRETRLYTEKLINDLLFEAEMGNVNKNTRIVTSANGSRNQIDSYQLNSTNICNTGVYQHNQYRTYEQQNDFQLPPPFAPLLHELQPRAHNISQSHSDTIAAQVSSEPQSQNSIASFFGNYQPSNED